MLQASKQTGKSQPLTRSNVLDPLISRKQAGLKPRAKNRKNFKLLPRNHNLSNLFQELRPRLLHSHHHLYPHPNRTASHRRSLATQLLQQHFHQRDSKHQILELMGSDIVATQAQVVNVTRQARVVKSAMVHEKS